jgi:O-antigen/teichoic acid export membrane protein
MPSLTTSSRPSDTTEAGGGRVATLARRITWSFANSLSGLVASAITLIAVSRVVEPHEYGRVAVVVSAWGLLLTPVTWCGSLLMRFGPVEYAASGRLRRSIAARLVFARWPLPLVLLGGLAYFNFVSKWSTLDLVLTAGWVVSATAYDVLQWSAVAAQRFGPMAMANVSLRATPLLVVVAAWIHPFRVSADVLLAANLVGSGLGCVALAIGLRRVIGIDAVDASLVRDMWRYARPLLFGVPGQAAVLWLDPLLLDKWAPRADVGRYQLAYPTFTIFSALGSAVNAVFSPELVRSSETARSAVIGRYARTTQPLLAVTSALAAFGLSCVVAPLARVILPASYAMTADLIAILSIAGGLLLAFWSLLPLVTVTDNVASQQWSTFVQAIINVGLDVMLAPQFGSSGVAIANVAAWMVAYAILSLLIRARVGVPLWPLWLIGSSAAVAACAVLGGVGWSSRIIATIVLLGGACTAALRLYAAKSS